MSVENDRAGERAQCIGDSLLVADSFELQDQSTVVSHPLAGRLGNVSLETMELKGESIEIVAANAEVSAIPEGAQTIRASIERGELHGHPLEQWRVSTKVSPVILGRRRPELPIDLRVRVANARLTHAVAIRCEGWVRVKQEMANVADVEIRHGAGQTLDPVHGVAGQHADDQDRGPEDEHPSVSAERHGGNLLEVSPPSPVTSWKLAPSVTDRVPGGLHFLDVHDPRRILRGIAIEENDALDVAAALGLECLALLEIRSPGDHRVDVHVAGHVGNQLLV